MASSPPRERLDRALVSGGHFSSRAKAQAAIAAGGVTVNGQTVTDAARLISPDAVVTAAPAHPWVSRGGVKLAAALDHFAVDVAGRHCLDVGASTGGFTQVLLERGAYHVTAVDVGRDQFDVSLRGEARVTLRESVDARDLAPDQFPEPPSLIVADVSFISLTKALPAALQLATADAVLIALVKPQFEVGRSGLARGGIVRDGALRAKAVEDVSTWLSDRGWVARPALASPIRGGDGNEEYLLAADRT
ncbi:TlyA family rRNA (cytidine-2'-O)-methyltransferase [Agaricicola taiwanensis]|uniref:TlyA family rRNA (Cytidine-2'-O)-methyltransferase n=1 Tax=Agaricicola taiwanensis TaxID=591372 RepID=A0A8J2VNL4_9RHOB|nr:TlyA family RNA methyltransferase [Agaricicola taiwanensis]GGE35826.1 TlyA family rRNA (cytidine-2'-O)-methyltransferase [Agaricicola taiwanensis]